MPRNENKRIKVGGEFYYNPKDIEGDELGSRQRAPSTKVGIPTANALTQSLAFPITTPENKTITVLNEGSVVDSNVNKINFVGADVMAVTDPNTGQVNVIVLTESEISHWNSTDGEDGPQLVIENFNRVLSRISKPTNEGNPYFTGGWQSTIKETINNSVIEFTTPSETIGFGGDSNMKIEVFRSDASGNNILMFQYTTDNLNSNGNYGNSFCTVNISQYGELAGKYKAKATVQINIKSIFENNNLQGGRFYTRITHKSDSLTDGGNNFVYNQPLCFLDVGSTPPIMSSNPDIIESTNIITKHLSGIEYYTLNSEFNIILNNMLGLNSNTQNPNKSLSVNTSKFGITSFDASPFETNSSNFSLWNDLWNDDVINFNKTDKITRNNFRYISNQTNITSKLFDSFNESPTYISSNKLIMIDTYGITSTDLVEDFDDENRRQDSTYNSGNPTGNWNSNNILTLGNALVFGGRLMIPSASMYITEAGPGSPNNDWTMFKPNLNGSNPNYSSFTTSSSYYRTFVDSSNLSRNNFSIQFEGIFVENATKDLENGHLEIFIRRRNSTSGGNFGPTSPALLLHGNLYNFSDFDDGISNGYIRLGSSKENIVNGTFGGLTCETGFFMEIKINNSIIQIDKVSVILN